MTEFLASVFPPSPWYVIFWLAIAAASGWVALKAGKVRFYLAALPAAALYVIQQSVFNPSDATQWLPTQLVTFWMTVVVWLLGVLAVWLVIGTLYLFEVFAPPGTINRPFGSFERMLALRYLGAKREHGGLAFISVVSVVGITLGVSALIFMMSVMNGFRLELINKIVGFESHVFIDTRGAPQSAVESLIEELRTRPGVENVEPLHEGTGLASAYGRSEGIQVRGIRPEDLRKNKLISDSISAGQKLRDTPGAQWPRTPVGQGSLDRFGDEGALSQDIVMGDAFAYALGVGVGDKVTLTQANGARTILGTAPRTKTYTISAIYHVGNERFDRYVVFLPIEASKLLFGYDQGYPWVGLRVSNPDGADDFVKQLEKEKPYGMQSWIQRNGAYMSALVVERNVMRLILFIVVIITSLNIITGVLMLVKNKARDIAILRTIGATRAGVVRIFLMTGTVLGMTGVAVGVAMGSLGAIYIAPIQHFIEDIVRIFNPKFEGLFPPSIYQLDSLPAQLEWGEVGWVAGMAFIVTLLMSVVPSMWAARLNPVEALRFE